jgi:hypothetical protein
MATKITKDTCEKTYCRSWNIFQAYLLRFPSQCARRELGFVRHPGVLEAGVQGFSRLMEAGLVQPRSARVDAGMTTAWMSRDFPAKIKMCLL